MSQENQNKNTSPVATPEPSFYQNRMQQLGVTEDNNYIEIADPDADYPANGFRTQPIFTEDKNGNIEILVYTIDRNRISLEHKGDGKMSQVNATTKPYKITRLKNPIVKKDGDLIKYLMPKGQGTYPFFPPSLVDKFDKETRIDTLFITEGYFKAWAGCLHGLDVVGVSSITHLKEKESGKMHIDIRRLRDACKVKRMVWLTDGDCLDITSKELTDGKDLYKRPHGFFRSCENFKNLLDDWDGDKWFFHIDTENILIRANEEKVKTITRDQVKGLDDLLMTYSDKIADIVSDAKTVAGNSQWFAKNNITTGTSRIFGYFKLTNVMQFYLYHVERRPELKTKEFIFNGTRYRYDDTQNECKVVTPAAAKLYFRVGDTYYKFVDKVNEEGQIERGFEKRLKSTIQDDHGKKFCEHIPKYEVFCNYPSHTDYQQVINNNFNVYFPFEHEPTPEPCTEEDCQNIIAFFKHIFGEKQIVVKQKEGNPINTSYHQLGLDLVQIMLQKPTQRLPILCLVSRENETGKSTFGNLMKAIFTNNATTVGNNDLADDFNSFWATKLLIMCDETKIDKQAVVEKVKSLTFAKKIGMNAKGKDKIEIPFFGKFMFFTNNEENFIYASEEDLRYWVIKVPKIKEKNPDFEQQMLDEIPNFLSFLNHRKLVAPRITRMWFDPVLLKTEALQRVIAHSHSSVKKDLLYHLKQMFLDFGVDKIEMSCKAIRDNFFKNKEENYILKVLKDEMNMQPVQSFFYKDRKYDNEQGAIDAAKIDQKLENDFEALHLIQRKSIVKRYSYPRMEVRRDNMTQKTETLTVLVSDLGRPYCFHRNDFVDSGDMSEITEEMKFINAMEPDKIGANGGHQLSMNVVDKKTEGIDDLPF